MKSRKLFTFLFTMLVLFVFVAPSMAKAVEGNSVAVRTTNVTIHKMELFNDPGTSLPKDHDGTTNHGLDGIVGSGGYTELPGVEFSYWEIDDGATFDDLKDLTVMELTVDYGIPVVLPLTDANGEVMIDDLEDGYYFFKETFTPVNVTKQIASPFLLGLPVMNAEGTAFITDLHIYPKNVTVRGAVVLEKFVGEEKLKNAGFRLYEGVYPAGTEYDPEGPDEAIEYFTDVNGEIIINNLPEGYYYFIETTAVFPYLINTDPLDFKIEVNGEVIVDVNELRVDEIGDVQFVRLNNYEEPDISKEIEGGVEFSAFYNEEIDFALNIELPADILTYDELTVTDTIDTKLDYLDSLVVVGLVNGVETTLTDGVEFNATELDGNRDLVIDFDPEKLTDGQVPFTDIRITFKAAINETAVMGQGIPNTATVDYDNGSTTGDEESNEVNAYTGGRKFLKYSDTEAKLPEAKFIIVNNMAKEKYLALNGGEYSWINIPAGNNLLALPNAVVLESDGDGLFEILGLKYGTYYLYEIVAPISSEGYPYNLIEDPISFEIDDTSYFVDPEVVTPVLQDPTGVLNILGPQIPQTGGMGTALFTLIGGGLMGFALILNKKRSRS